MGPREHSFKDTSHHRAWHHKRGWPPGCIPMGFPPPSYIHLLPTSLLQDARSPRRMGRPSGGL